jgi:spore coat polysaccharide biosynthesis protein SpsF
MHIVASIQARLGSTRLPGKVLFHLGDRRLLQWAYDRAVAATTTDEVVAAIGDESENTAVQTYCNRSDIDYIVGPEDDLLTRHLAIANRTDCDVLVRITADCPFVPSKEIDRVVEHHLSNDSRYTTNVTDRMPIGTAVDAIDPDLLREFRSLGETHPVKRARSEPEVWGTVWADNPSWHEVSDAHIAVDTPKDYWSLVDAVDAVGTDPRTVAKWINQ